MLWRKPKSSSTQKAKPEDQSPAFQPPSSDDKILAIVNAFGATMMDCAGPKFYDATRLPFKKVEIRTALAIALSRTTDPAHVQMLKFGLMSLSAFQPGIGSEPLDPMPLPPAGRHMTSEEIRASAHLIVIAGESPRLAALKARQAAEDALTVKFITEIEAAGTNSAHEKYAGRWEDDL